MRIEERDGQLAITDFDEFEAYRIASKVEKDGMAFYQKLAARVEKPELKETLSFLADEEKKHYEFFSGCLDRLREGKEDANEEDDLLSSMDYGIFQPYQSIDELDAIIADIARAIRLALVVEKKSMVFYELCQGQVTSSEAKEQLGAIIAEEEKHKVRLEGILRSAEC